MIQKLKKLKFRKKSSNSKIITLVIENSVLTDWWKLENLIGFKSDDPYKFTRILSETNKSQAIVDVLEREFGASLLFRICFLQAFNILIEEKGLTPTLASAKLSVLFNALLIPRSVSAHEDSPEELLKRILNLQEFINVKKSPETT